MKETYERKVSKEMTIPEIINAVTAVQVMVRTIAIADGKVILIHEERKHPGTNRITTKTSLPGGKPEDGETIEQVALRELEEETGINESLTENANIWIADTWVDIPHRSTSGTTLVVFVAVKLNVQTPPNLVSEVDKGARAFWSVDPVEDLHIPHSAINQYRDAIKKALFS